MFHLNDLLEFQVTTSFLEVVYFFSRSNILLFFWLRFRKVNGSRLAYFACVQGDDLLISLRVCARLRVSYAYLKAKSV